ncbi:MAG TPA: hypothetical protein PKE55_13565 [Kiritimatiellia bacterium]|nr:hypothetical protein [Kiritimatiellia bacterium]
MQLDVNDMLATLNQYRVDYLVVGGIHFLFRHEPILTYDLDVWIDDTPENRTRCMSALVALQASWGETEEQWRSVESLTGDWLLRQSVFSLLTRSGALDVFRTMVGLSSWQRSNLRAIPVTTSEGISYRGLSDEDMLACQEALDENHRKLDRIRILKHALHRANHES